MKTLHILYHLAKADFFERARRFSFLLILAAVIYMGVLVNNGTAILALGSGDPNPLLHSFRGEFNSAWIGTMTALVVNAFLGLAGFYLVNDCIKRDIRTGVGQIIATTPISRGAYLIGKWISNCLVFFVLVLILAAAAAIMVLLQGEAALDAVALLMPFLAVALPYMALTAALAVVFETIPLLRGAVGNGIYFFLWGFLAYLSVSGIALPLVKDPIGVNVFSASLRAAAQATYPNDTVGTITVGMGNVGMGSVLGSEFKIFNWPGLDWAAGIIARQWLWAVLGLVLILLSTLWFSRFDPSREGMKRRRGKHEEAQEGKPGMMQKRALRRTAFISRLTHLIDLSPLVSKVAQMNPFLGVLFAELRLLLNGRRWWWWLGIAGLNIAMLVSPIEMTKEYLLPIAWLWPLPIWSDMGGRERKNNTSQMVFSSARPVLRQLPAAWLAGVLVTTLFGISGGLVFLVSGDLPALAGWLGAAIFIPTLALALGVFSSGSRAFEVIYFPWWYVGPWQKGPGMDFISGPPHIYVLAAAGLLLLAAFWRSRQVRV